ncbi:hypothetical protein ACFLRB_05795, partial [Acidobacteriota bacterium]
MNPQISAIVSILFIITGFITVLLMLKLQGSPKDRESNQSLTRFHRILGYIFLIIFFVTFVFMAKRIAGTGSPRAAIHMTLAFLLVSIIFVKIFIARFFKGLYPNLIILGLLIFFLSFTMIGITTGYYFLNTMDGQPVIKQSDNRKKENEPAQVEIPGANIAAAIESIQKKCATCHNLDRIKMAVKPEKEWRTT